MNRILTLAVVAFVLFITCAYAAIPHLINYQGRLTDQAGTPLQGTYTLTFKVYNAQTGGTLLAAETFENLVIDKGMVSVLLGDGAAVSGVSKISDLAFDAPYFLEILFGDEVLTPRQRITSAAYSMRADTADDVATLPRGIIAMWSGTIATIPQGWALCDGSNGTPDLRDRFIVGARQDDADLAKTEVTGALTKSGDGQIPSHTHTTGVKGGVNQPGNDTHVYGGGNPFLTGSTDVFTSSAYGAGTKNIAVYYALAFIMRI